MAVVGVLEIQMMADMARLSNDLKRANGEITSAVRGFNNILNTLGVGISFAFFADLARRSNEFEKSLAKISTQIDDTTGDIDRLANSAKNFAAQFGTAQVEQTNAYYEIISAGIEDTAKATEILNTANKLAIGGMTSLGVSVDGLTNIMNSYAGKVESADAVSDALFIGMKAGKATMEELSSGLGKVTPLAATLNVSFDELVAVIATLSKQGIQTSESITGVRAILSAVAKPASEAAKLAGQLGLEFNAASLQAKGFAGFIQDVISKTDGSTTALSTLFGRVEALVPVLSLAGTGGQDFNNILGQMGGKAGATQEAFEEMAASPGFKVNQLMAAISNAAITLGAKLSDVLTPAIVKATQAFNNLFLTQEQSPLEKQIALISSLEKKLASELDKKNIPFGDIFLFDKRQADLYEQQLEDAREDLLKLQQAQQSAASSSSNLKTEIEELTGTGGGNTGVTGLGTSVDKTKQKMDSFVESIRKQAAEAGKTANEIKRMEAANLGVLRVVEPYLDIIEAQAVAEEDLRISRQKQADDLRKIEQLTQSVRTKQEVYNDTVKELDTLLSKGLGMEAYNRALKDAQDQLAKTESSALDRSRNFWDTNEQIWIQGVRNVQTSLANGLFNIFDDGLKGMVSGVKRAVGQMIAEFASIKILQSTGIAGLLGMGSTAAFASGGAASGGGLSALNLASLGSGALNLVQGGFGLTGALGGGLQSLGGAIGSNSLFQFGAGVGGDLLAAGGAGSVAGSLGGSIGGLAGPAIVAAGADMILRSLFGDKKLGGTAGDVLGYVPIVGTLINGLFGRGAPKFQNEALVGNVSAGGFDGVLNQAFKEKGGLARSDRVSNFIADTDSGDLLNQFGRLSESGNIPGALRDSATDPAVKRALEVGEFLDETFTDIGNALQQTAEKLGLSSDSLSNFSAELDLVSEKGETLSEVQIGDEIARISDEMAKTLIPNLDEFAKTGESATETVVRLGNQFAVLENAVSAIFGMQGQSAEDFVNQFSIPDQTAFLDAAGGIEAFSQKINQFIDGLPDTDKLDILQTSLSEALNAVGVDFIPTMDQFRDAMQSGELSAEQFLKGLDLQGALQQYEDLSNAVAEPLNNVIERIGAASQAAIDPANQLLSKLDALGLGALDTSKELIDAIDTLGASSDLTETQFDGLVKVMDETSSGIESLIDAERKLADERERAAALDRREFVAGRRAGETRDAAKAQEEIDRMVEVRFMNLQKLADHFAKASAARELSFGDNGALNADQFVDILRNDPRVNDLAASDFGFDVREFFDLKSIQAKYGDLLRQDVDGVFEILQDAVIDGFKKQFGSGADQIRALTEQLETSTGIFAPDPVDTANIERERIALETQLMQLQGDTAGLRQRELDALDESNRELLQRIFNLQDEQQRIAEAEQARAAIAQERAGLETQLMQLMGNTEGLRQRELEAIDGSNRGLLQRIFNLQDEQAEQQRLAAIAQEREGFETQLMQLQGDTAGLRQRELDALDESNRSILERIFALQDENAELERQRAIADERFGLETQLLTLQGDTAGLRQRELDALDESNRALLERIFALQDAAIAEEELARQQEKNISNTFGVLQRSIDAEKNKLAEEYNKQLSITQSRIRDVSESLGKLTQLSSLLNQGIESLNPLSQQSARAQLQEAIQGAQKGIFPDAANLGRAVTTLTSLGTDSFSSREDFIRAQSENANLLKELSGFVEAEKTLEERTLDAITAQADRLQAGFDAEINRLDGILDSAQTQIDVLNGIDVSIKSVADAIAAFNAASTAAGGGEISAGAGGLLADTGATDDPLQAVRKVVRNIGGKDFNLAGFGLQRENDILGQRISFSNGGGLVRADFEAGVLTLLDDAKNVIYQEVFDDLTKLDEVSKLNAVTLAKKYDLPAFATGSDFVPFTGPAIVHKGERIINNDQNRDIVDALKQLVQSVSKSTESNERLRKMIRDSLVETDDGFAQRTSAAA